MVTASAICKASAGLGNFYFLRHNFSHGVFSYSSILVCCLETCFYGHFHHCNENVSVIFGIRTTAKGFLSDIGPSARPWRPTWTVTPMCQSIGHVAQCNGPPSGAGNLFGRAFVASNQAWMTVCPQDSDGDGYTNGEELGDPSCTFTTGTTPERSTNLSHPGFACSTFDNPFCLVDTTPTPLTFTMTPFPVTVSPDFNDTDAENETTLPPPPFTTPPPPPSTIFASTPPPTAPPTIGECLTGTCYEIQNQYAELVQSFRDAQQVYADSVQDWREVVDVWRSQQESCSGGSM
eukprot:scpid73886/ scgid4089/ Temptin